jgi:Lon protease-like protein
MRPAQTSIATLPEIFPVFPLIGALLLPHGQLPLNIFEPRYLAMTEDALAAGRLLAMIQPDRSKPSGENGSTLFRVGCLGRISSFSETDDGRYLITLTGVARFALVEELEMRRGYRRIRGDFRRYAEDLAAPVLDGFDRKGLLAALRGYFVQRGIEVNWKAIDEMADTALVNSLSMVCPFDALEKQALLEAPSLADRADTLRALLNIDSHEPPEHDAPDASPRRRFS